MIEQNRLQTCHLSVNLDAARILADIGGGRGVTCVRLDPRQLLGGGFRFEQKKVFRGFFLRPERTVGCSEMFANIGGGGGFVK